MLLIWTDQWINANDQCKQRLLIADNEQANDRPRAAVDQSAVVAAAAVAAAISVHCLCSSVAADWCTAVVTAATNLELLC